MGYAIPIIQIRDLLLVSIQVELTDRLVGELKEGVAREIRRRNATGLIIEISGVETFDSYIARSIRDVAQIAKLMGVSTVIAGFDAPTATTLVEMGMAMTGVATALSLDSALELLAEARAERVENERLVLDELALDAVLAQA
jgi:rsbT antagonist protein RsbS